MPRFTFVFRPAREEQVITQSLLITSYTDEEYAQELADSGLFQQMTLFSREDQFGIDVYENTNYYLLSLPIPLTDSETEEMYEPGEYIIPKNVSTFSRNARSSSNNSTQPDAYNILNSIHTGTNISKIDGVSIDTTKAKISFANTYLDNNNDNQIDSINGRVTIDVSDVIKDLKIQIEPMHDKEEGSTTWVRYMAAKMNFDYGCSFVSTDKEFSFVSNSDIKLGIKHDPGKWKPEVNPNIIITKPKVCLSGNYTDTTKKLIIEADDGSKYNFDVNGSDPVSSATNITFNLTPTFIVSGANPSKWNWDAEGAAEVEAKLKQITMNDIPNYFKQNEVTAKSLINAISSDNPEEVRLTMMTPFAPLITWLQGQKIPQITFNQFFILTLPCTCGEKVPEECQDLYHPNSYTKQALNCEINVNLTEFCKPTIENISIGNINYFCDNLPAGLTLSKDGDLTGSTQNITKPTTLTIKCNVIAADKTPQKIIYQLEREYYVLLVPYPNLKVSLSQRTQVFENNELKSESTYQFYEQGVAVPEFSKTTATSPNFDFKLIKDQKQIEIHTKFAYGVCFTEEYDAFIGVSTYPNEQQGILFYSTIHHDDLFNQVLQGEIPFQQQEKFSPNSLTTSNFTFVGSKYMFTQCQDVTMVQELKNNKIPLKKIFELKGKSRMMDYTYHDKNSQYYKYTYYTCLTIN